MLVVIGDIHGCYDGLRFFIDEEINNLKDYYNIKLIFLGDYIDYGPSSKEVIDYINSLDYDKVLLKGNHEDVVEMYLKGHFVFIKYRTNQWLLNSLGGISTLRSLCKDSPVLNDEYSNDLDEATRNNIIESLLHINTGKIKMDKKYLKFIEGLKYTHTETIKLLDTEKKILFSHSIPNVRVPIDELLKAKTYEEFHHLDEKYDLYMEGNSLWNRNLVDGWLREEVDGKKIHVVLNSEYLIVHGHTPTFAVNKYYDSHSEKFVNKELLKRVSETFEPFYYENFEEERIMAINIDLGLVYNKAFGALFIPENDDELKKNYSYKDLDYIMFDFSDGGFRQKYFIHGKIPDGLERILNKPKGETNDNKTYKNERYYRNRDEESPEIKEIRKFLRLFWGLMWDNLPVLIKRVPKGKEPDFNPMEDSRELKIYFQYIEDNDSIKNDNLPEQDDEYNIFYSPAKYGHYMFFNSYIKDGSDWNKDKFVNTRFLHIDLNNNGKENLKKLEEDANLNNIPKPTLVVQTAEDEYNVFWKLKYPETDIIEHQLYLEKLCNKYNGNPEAINSIRLFRLPGYKNLEKNFLVRIVYMSDIFYDIEEFEKLL